LNFLGATAVDDKLQDKVPEAIAKFIDSNIKVWVLTGDKQETAIEIGKSCKLIQEYMSLEEVNLSKELIHDDEQDKLLTERLENLLRSHKNKRISLVTDGATLALILKKQEFKKIFFEVCMSAASVICCRVSPKQKADVVALCKEYSKGITLSIGDGNNDVPMILEAHIGVGIRGKEGT
jgi:magnesium-transporting ATPase (P-type)